MVRLGYKTHFSAAYYEGEVDTDASKNKRSKLAFGFTSSLLSSNDPLVVGKTKGSDGRYSTAWTKCLDEVYAQFPMDPGKYQDLQNDLQRKKSPLTKELIELRRKLGELTLELSGNGEIADRSSLEGRKEALVEMIKVLEGKVLEITKLEIDLKKQSLDSQGLNDPQSPRAKQVQQCRERISDIAARGASLDVGAGLLLHGDPGKLKNLSDGSGAFWFAGRVPLSFVNNQASGDPASFWMIGASGRFAFDEFVATGNATVPTVKTNSWDAWAGLEHMDADSRLALQVGYQHRKAKQPVPEFDKSSVRYLASYTQRLSDKDTGIWVKLSYGYADQQGDDDKRVLVALTYSPPAIFNIFNTGKK